MPRLPALLRGSLGLFATRIGVVGFNFVSLLIVALVVERGAFGRFVLLWSYAQVASALLSAGGPAYLLREYAGQAGAGTGLPRVRQALVLAFVWPAVIGALLGVLGLALRRSGFVPIEDPPSLLLVVAVAYLLNLLSIGASLLRVQERTSLAMTAKDAGPQVVLVVVALILAAAGPVRERELMLGVAAGLILLLLAGAVLAWPRGSGPAAARAGTPPIPGGGPLAFWGSAVLTALWGQADIVLAGHVLAPVDLGAYGILRRLANLAGLPQIVANWMSVVPVRRAFLDSDRDRLQRACRNVLGISLLPALALGVGLVLAAPVLLNLFDIGQVHAGVLTLAVLVLAALVNVASGVNFAVASQCHLEAFGLASRALGIGATVAVVLWPWGDPGLLRVGMATLASSLAANLLLLAVIWTRLRIDPSVLSLSRRLARP